MCFHTLSVSFLRRRSLRCSRPRINKHEHQYCLGHSRLRVNEQKNGPAIIHFRQVPMLTRLKNENKIRKRCEGEFTILGLSYKDVRRYGNCRRYLSILESMAKKKTFEPMKILCHYYPRVFNGYSRKYESRGLVEETRKFNARPFVCNS